LTRFSGGIGLLKNVCGEVLAKSFNWRADDQREIGCQKRDDFSPVWWICGWMPLTRGGRRKKWKYTMRPRPLDR